MLVSDFTVSDNPSCWAGYFLIFRNMEDTSSFFNLSCFSGAHRGGTVVTLRYLKMDLNCLCVTIIGTSSDIMSRRHCGFESRHVQCEFDSKINHTEKDALSRRSYIV